MKIVPLDRVNWTSKMIIVKNKIKAISMMKNKIVQNNRAIRKGQKIQRVKSIQQRKMFKQFKALHNKIKVMKTMKNKMLFKHLNRMRTKLIKTCAKNLN